MSRADIFSRKHAELRGQVINILLHILEVLGSNIGPDTGYPD
jgi:hypothetical protein